MTDTPMTPDRERMIRIWHEELRRLTDPTAVARREALGDLLAEVDRLRAELEASICRCFDPSHHAQDCKSAEVVWDGIKYNAAAWYRDAEGIWWMACGIDGQGQPLMRVWNDPSNEPVPVGEVESDYGPLHRSDDGPDELNQKAPW